MINCHEDTYQDHSFLLLPFTLHNKIVLNVLAYEALTAINFKPTVFIGISNTLDIKVYILLAQEPQVERINIPGLNVVGSALATAYFRSIQGCLNSAESFIRIQ